MQILLAVIDDLFQFAYRALFGATSTSTFQLYHERVLNSEVAPQPTLPTFSSVGTLLKERVEPQETVLHTDATYFVGEQETYLYNEPVFAFDSAVCTLPYGTSVTVHKLGGRWAHVSTDVAQGWVLKDALHENESDVFPSLTQQVEYTHDHPQTEKLRRLIGDEFSGERSGLSLTDAEFVTYKLHERGKTIPWTMERPRTPGVWQRLLRGREGVYINIVPKVGTIIEYTHDDIGHVGYVEAVFSDESMQISSVGLIDEGVFTQELLTRDVWKEMHPVFIEIK